jgi:hypothetical protein
MMSNVISFEPPAAAAADEQVEPLDAAVLEVSERIAENNVERRLLFSRLDELRGLTPLRRRRTRPAPPAMTEPVIFFSIEEAEASTSAPLQVARGGR